MKLKFLEQYKHLGKEIYILFWGRIVTSMGSLIWPLLTLILENKLGYDATLIAGISFAMSMERTRPLRSLSTRMVSRYISPDSCNAIVGPLSPFRHVPAPGRVT